MTAAARIATRLAAQSGTWVVVTLGGDGALVAGADGTTEHVPPRPTPVVDTTGAGDTFNGVLAAGVARGDEFLTAVRLAAVAAGLSIGHAGARAGMPEAAALAAASTVANMRS